MKSAPVSCETARPTVSAITLGESRRRSFFERIFAPRNSDEERDPRSLERRFSRARERNGSGILRQWKSRLIFPTRGHLRRLENAALAQVVLNFLLDFDHRDSFPRPYEAEAAPDDVERQTSLVQGLSVAP